MLFPCQRYVTPLYPTSGLRISILSIIFNLNYHNCCLKVMIMSMFPHRQVWETCVFEMDMGRLFISPLNNLEQCLGYHGMSSKISKNQNIVYSLLIKTLCDETYKDWTRCLFAISISIKCAFVTRDSESDLFCVVALARAISTTPEKWDIIIRK